MESQIETNIALFFLLACVSVQNNGEAAHKSLEAYTRYTGIDKQLDLTAKNVQNEIPSETRLYLGKGIFIAKTIIDRRIVIEWRFK